MSEFLFLRHGRTAGNLRSNYVGGRTDEPLCPAGIEALRAARDACPERFAAQRLFVSPMLRCRETAALCFPHLTPTPVEEFRECDFGVFEGKNFQDLEQDPRYRAWVEGNCAGPIPEGEHPDAFMARCRAAFAPLLEHPAPGRTALVVHGGTIMAILSAFARPERPYFDYHVSNGGGYLCTEENGLLRIVEQF